MALGLIGFYLILGFIPIENLFYTFQTPEAAFHYQYLGQIEAMEEGDVSTMFIYSKNDVLSYAFVPKVSGGWKLKTGFNQNAIIKKRLDHSIISIYRFEDSDDYYIVIWDPYAQGVITINDIRGSTFKNIVRDNATQELNVIYYAYVKGLDDTYTLTIAGQNIDLFNIRE